MKEKDQHLRAFEVYYGSRNILKVARETGISRQSLSKWKRELHWDERCKDRDHEIDQGVQDLMIPQWTAVKVTLIQAFLNQINAAVRLGIAAENSRDMVAISRELRALLGEGEKIDIEFTGIEYQLVEKV